MSVYYYYYYYFASICYDTNISACTCTCNTQYTTYIMMQYETHEVKFHGIIIIIIVKYYTITHVIFIIIFASTCICYNTNINYDTSNMF